MQLFSYAYDILLPMLLQKLIMDMFNVNSEKVCKNAVYIFDNYFLIISRRHSVLCILQAKQSAALLLWLRKVNSFFFIVQKKKQKFVLISYSLEVLLLIKLFQMKWNLKSHYKRDQNSWITKSNKLIYT